MDINNLLNGILERKAQSMQRQNNFPNFTLELPQSLNAGDFLQQQPQNEVLRSLSRTPVKLPSYIPAAPQAAPMQSHPQVSPDFVPPAQIMPKQEEEPLKLTQAQRFKKEYETERAELAHKRALEKEELKLKDKKQVRIDKETLPYYDKIKKQMGSVAEVNARLDEMEDLLNTGQVQEGALLKGMEALSHVPYVGPFAGAIQQAFLTHESGVFKKLSTDFLRDAKPYFGNNLSTREVELFLERVPSLMLTNEGNRAVIRNFRALNDYLEATDKIMEGVIAENGGERPKHLEARVQERMKPAAENLRKAFRDSAKLIKSPAQEAQKRRKAYYKKVVGR